MRTGRPALNLSGQKFTRLQVVKAFGVIGSDRVWQCLCDCGKLVIVRAFALKAGNTRSCGCLKSEVVVQRNIDRGIRLRLVNPPKRVAVSGRTLGGLESMFSESCSFEIFNTAGWKGKSGIYALINNVTGKLYVGSASCLKGRISHHWSKLRHGKHENSYLQHSWTLHGETAFSSVIIEQCSIESLMAREAFWIGRTKCADKSFGYNLDSIVMRKMHCQETKDKIGLAHRGKTKSLEHRANLSKAKMGIKLGTRTPEQRLNYSRAATGRKWPMASRLKMSAKHKGKIISPEHKAKISAFFKNRKQSDEHIQKRFQSLQLFHENRKKEAQKCQLHFSEF